MKKVIICIISLCFFSACSAIFEKSIENKSIDIYTPGDSLATKEYTQQFYWEKVSGATNYRLQIAEPAFNPGQIKSIVLDTIVTANKISVSLNAGEYEWRLRAQNGSSETTYITRKLFILQAAFDERPIIVSLPASSFSTYDSSVSFSWKAVSGAENYYIEIDELAGGFTNSMVTRVDVPQTQSYVSLKKRGSYKWRMYADSAGIKSLYSNTGRVDFSLDTVTLGAPLNNKMNVPTSQIFTWTEPKNKLSTDRLTYKFYLLNSLNIMDVIDDNMYPIELEDQKTELIKNLEKGHVYYWTVIAFDQFGKESAVPQMNKFTVTQ
jgi:hypothetical protein